MFQRNCIEFALKAKPVRRYIPKHRFQYKIWWFVTSQPFEYTIFVLIMINTITLAMKFYKQPQGYTDALDVMNLFFTAVFALEFVFKLAAFRFKVSSKLIPPSSFSFPFSSKKEEKRTPNFETKKYQSYTSVL